MTNVEVVVSFLKGEIGWGSSLTSDGIRLLSYGVTIAEMDNGKVIVSNFEGDCSRTTQRHIRMVQELAKAFAHHFTEDEK